MISSVDHLGSSLYAARQARRDLTDSNIISVRDEEGRLKGLRWPYRLNDKGMCAPAKKMKGSWNGDYWHFPTQSAAEEMLTLLRRKFSEFHVIEVNEHWFSGPHIHQTASNATDKAKTEAETKFFIMPVSDGVAACILSCKLSLFTPIDCLHDEVRQPTGAAWPFPKFARSEKSRIDVYGVQHGAGESVVILSAPAIIKGISESIAAAGAEEQLSLADPFQTSSSVKILTSGWAVAIWIDLSNPRHWPLRHWHGHSENGWVKISTTRRKWQTIWKERVVKAGLEWQGDDPEAQDLSVPANFDTHRVQGWDTPAPNGHLLHAYQKKGAQFCASRGMRALLGDEMGVGKTVQAIAAAEATQAPRVVVICPANARYVWESEIQGWGGRGPIQHIGSQLETLDMAARWHILTYDLLAARSEIWRLNDEEEVKSFLLTFPDFSESMEIIKGKFPRKVTLNSVLEGVPIFADPKRSADWEKKMRRLRGELLEQILGAGPLLVILDEAHRVKNRDAKRTKAIQRIAAGEHQVLMLTGTPLRNNEHEAAVLLSLLAAEAAKTLSAKNGYSIQDVKDYLSHFMLRRTKEEVLPDLPAKTRQRIDLDKLDPGAMERYCESMAQAQSAYFSARKQGLSEAAARQSMQSAIEVARTALGVAKVLGGGVADLVLDVVENKGCSVVFCAHHDASDALKVQLEEEDLKVAIIDGRVPPKRRAAIVADFQEGRLDVVIGGIYAAGEAITLTRADTAIFVELDWVPAALLQAEDRIHRVGQTSNCQVIQVVARMLGENLDEMMVGLLGKKMAVIGALLDEDASNIVGSSVASELHDLLLGHVALAESASATTAQNQRQKESVDVANDTEPEAIQQPTRLGVIDDKPKPRRGRPKVYVDHAPPTSTERSKQSIKALATAGGKRVMLRLSPEAHEALKVIMAITGNKQETATINQALITRKNELLRVSTIN